MTRIFIVLVVSILGAPAIAQLIDRESVFTRARAIAAETLEGIEAADLIPFRINYDLTLLETGNAAGGFEVDLLLQSSRSVVPAREVIAAAADAEAAARLEGLLAGLEFAYHYQTVWVRFAEQGEMPPSAEFSTVLLNRDPERQPDGVSSEPAGDPQLSGRSTL